MKLNPTFNLGLLLPLLIVFSSPSYAVELQSKLGTEVIGFNDNPKHTEQKDQYFSAVIEPEIYQALSDNQELNIKLFYRYDAQSTSRTHADIREFMVNHYADDWEFNLGIGKVFWGTTESRHLVDVINQVDWIESLDNEVRLGQPMIQAKLIKDWGVLDLFVLPYFRELEFLGKEARPRFNPVIQKNEAIFQDKAKQKHVDLAARWSQTFGDLDLGVSVFMGTQRRPIFKPEISNTGLKLIPVYVQTKQLGIDLQYIYADYLLKAELLSRASHNIKFQEQQSFAAVIGVEYTLVGILGSVYDIGLIGEYLYDDWQQITPFQKDFMTGVRLVLNDEQSSELLIGNITDLDDGTQFWNFEGSRRLGDSWKAELLARVFANVDSNNFLRAYKQDDLFSFRLYYYF
jgi:hypothetical protein